jgi:hypothetical protein
MPSPLYVVQRMDTVTGPFGYIRLLGDRAEGKVGDIPDYNGQAYGAPNGLISQGGLADEHSSEP